MNKKFLKRQFKLSRYVKKRLVKPFILIVCEGKKTEKHYFDSFRLLTSLVKILVKSTGRSAIDLIDKTIKIKENIEEKEGIFFDQVWCVFDKDNNNNFNEAIKIAKKNKINVAYSNPSFEIWYILHFKYSTSPMNARELILVFNKLLIKNCGIKYEKNCQKIFELIENNKHLAIDRAKRLMEHHKFVSGINPEVNNPSTTVYKLVIELDKYI